MEYWIVYDAASGVELYRGSGSVGTAAYQQLPEGLALLVVPHAVVAQADLDLTALRAALAVQVDAEAEAIRQRIVTPGSGQAMTYARKEAEARAFTAGAVAGPFLQAEAEAREMTVEVLAAEIIRLADEWCVVGSAIEGIRMGTKTKIAAAEDFAGIVAVHRADWDSLLAPAA